jgi:hypothetical protein
VCFWGSPGSGVRRGVVVEHVTYITSAYSRGQSRPLTTKLQRLEALRNIYYLLVLGMRALLFKGFISGDSAAPQEIFGGCITQHVPTPPCNPQIPLRSV